ncbi:putative ABC transport system ATP-binding protein [Actimicrobium sp. GrIS 1.19]|uniref:ABC transporter ATP-binding protein n=1 Tax=Actimicrobium sp. GrIS 1.19 TaxID=3071708 RepID=UPI002E0C6146|nr:putative ABC transport system ATP-binding protein [Actimicrobium sp. GrIS 1.19]
MNLSAPYVATPGAAALPVHSAAAAPLVRLCGVGKTYAGAGAICTALEGFDLQVQRGEFVAICGQSGSGKSTVLNLLGGLDRPSTGEIWVDGQAVHALPERDLAHWRGVAVGIVFQFFQLMPSLSALENVMLPMDLAARWPGRERRSRAMALLARLGIAAQADKLPSFMSGGQQQRVAVARALANAPTLLLADEPTGNLDTRNTAALLDLLLELVADGQTLVMVTHDPAVLRRAHRTITLVDGRMADAEGRHV